MFPVRSSPPTDQISFRANLPLAAQNTLRFRESDFQKCEIKRDNSNLYRAILNGHSDTSQHIKIEKINEFKKQLNTYLTANRDALEAIPELGKQGVDDLLSLAKPGVRELTDDVVKLAPLFFARAIGREVRIFEPAGRNTYSLSDVNNLNLPHGELETGSSPICLLHTGGYYDVIHPNITALEAITAAPEGRRSFDDSSQVQSEVSQDEAKRDDSGLLSLKDGSRGSGSLASAKESLGSLFSHQQGGQQRIVAAKNFTRKSMPNDDYSFYRSVLTGLHPNKKPSDDDIMELRRQVAKYVAQNKTLLEKNDSFQGKVGVQDLINMVRGDGEGASGFGDLLPPLVAQVTGREIRVLEPNRSGKAFVEQAVFPPQNPDLPPARGRLQEPPIYLAHVANRTHYNHLQPTRAFLEAEMARQVNDFINDVVSIRSGQDNVDIHKVEGFYTATNLAANFEGWTDSYSKSKTLEILDQVMKDFRSDFMADGEGNVNEAVSADNCFSRDVLLSSLLFDALNRSGLIRHPESKDNKKANVEIIGSIRIDYENGRVKNSRYAYHVAPLLRIKYQDFSQAKSEILTADPIYGYLPVDKWHERWRPEQYGIATEDYLNYVPVSELYVGNDRPKGEERFNVQGILGKLQEIPTSDVYSPATFQSRIDHTGFRDMIWNILQAKGESEVVPYKDNVGDVLEVKQPESLGKSKGSKKRQGRMDMSEARNRVKKAVDQNLLEAFDQHPVFRNKQHPFRQQFFSA